MPTSRTHGVLIPYHAAPGDFHRWTEEGVRTLLEGFEILLLEPRSGPASALSWQVASFAALVASLGIRSLQEPFFYFFTILIWPLKWLDLVLLRWPGAETMCLGFHAIVRRTDPASARDAIETQDSLA